LDSPPLAGFFILSELLQANTKEMPL
jgi:hypothetical protein